ncbi:hypothetical protein ABI_01960 [Asticcacaulis biprosthecium C19]|uniref:Uncharacterized protein n=1 Tax=Asticcacaulis biprosthecium C19 TaxID=715226 RepID=F4QIC9_9CAUL|nr:hypothetical protein ABI_01960 [Asticcacaulis biprosthecium C19]
MVTGAEIARQARCGHPTGRPAAQDDDSANCRHRADSKKKKERTVYRRESKDDPPVKLRGRKLHRNSKGTLT